MIDITVLPIDELRSDLADSTYDMLLAVSGMMHGEVKLVSGASIAERAGKNLLFIGRIFNELLRRGYQPTSFDFILPSASTHEQRTERYSGEGTA